MTLSAIKNTIGSTPAGPPACQHAPAILRGRGRMIGSLDRWRDKTDGRGGASGVRAGTEVLRLVYLEHRAVLWVCIGYIGVGGALLRMLHRPWPIELTDHVFATVWMTASTLWLLWRWVQSPRRLRSALIAPRVCGAALVALLAVPTQITFQSLKQSIGPVIGFHGDRWLSELSVGTHQRMASQWFAPFLDHPPLLRALDFIYVVWFPAMIAFALWCSWTDDRVLRQRAITAFLLIWVIAGTLVAAALSSAGPVYYGAVVRGPNPYAALVTKLDAMNSNHIVLISRASEKTLWTLYRNNTWFPFGGISAMPSLHVGIATLYALIAWRRSRAGAALLAAFVASIWIGSVTLGWHYPLDGYAGAALAGLCWWLAGRLQTEKEITAAIEVQALIHAAR